MICPFCGQETPDGGARCEYCGADLREEYEREEAMLREARRRVNLDRRLDAAQAAPPVRVEDIRRARELDERERRLQERERALKEAEIAARERVVQQREQAASAREDAVYAEEMRGARKASRRKEIEEEEEEEERRGRGVRGRGLMCAAFWVSFIGLLFCAALGTGQVEIPPELVYVARASEQYGAFCIVSGILALIGWVNNSRLFAALTLVYCGYAVLEFQAPFQLVAGVCALIAAFLLPRKGAWVR